MKYDDGIMVPTIHFGTLYDRYYNGLSDDVHTILVFIEIFQNLANRGIYADA